MYCSRSERLDHKDKELACLRCKVKEAWCFGLHVDKPDGRRIGSCSHEQSAHHLKACLLCASGARR
jgi:hypothetical protein